MDESLHNIDDLFYNGLEGYKEAPSARTWTEITAELDQPKSPVASVRSFWVLKTALILLLLFAGYALNEWRDAVVSHKSVVGSQQPAVSSQQDAVVSQQSVVVSQQPGVNNKQLTEIQSISTAATTKDNPQPATRNPQDAVDSQKPVVVSQQQPAKKLQTAMDQAATNLQLAASSSTEQKMKNTSSNPVVKVATKKQLSLSAFFAPSFTWAKLEDHEEHRPGGWGGRPHEDHHDISENEKAGFSYSAGAKLRLDLGKHVSVETGLSYSTFNTRQESKKLYADHDDNGDVRYRLNCSAGYSYLLPETSAAPAVGDSIMMNQSGYNVQYLNMPFLAGYAVGKGRLRAGIMAGLQFNILLKGRSSAELQQTTNSKTTVAASIRGLKKMTADMVTGISADYRVSPKFSVNLSPQGRFSLSSINQSGTVISRPGAFSLSAGIRYYF